MTAPDDAAPHDETCARCHRRICVCMYDKAPVEEVRDRGDNTARCNCWETGVPHKAGALGCKFPAPAAVRQVDPDAPGWASARDTVATGDRVVDECARVRRRMLGDTIVDDEESPVASAARVAFRLGWETALAARPAVADAVVADLGAAITEGVAEARLRERLAAEFRAFGWAAQYVENPRTPEEVADAVLAYPEMRALLDGEGS